MPSFTVQTVGSSIREASLLLGIAPRVGQHHVTDHDKFFISAMLGSRLLGCAAGGVLADGSGVVMLPPPIAHADENAMIALLEAAIEWFAGRQVVRVQTLTSTLQDSLLARGFQRQTCVLTLAAKTINDPQLGTAPQFASAPQLERVDCETKPRLTQLLERTYVDTLDIPEHPPNGTADLHEHLQQSKLGVWWIIQDGEEDVGLLLLGDPQSRRRNLLYLGLVPSARNQGVGRRVLASVLTYLRQHSIRTVQTQVDQRNQPAIRCYSACGFFELSRTDLFVRAG